MDTTATLENPAIDASAIAAAVAEKLQHIWLSRSPLCSTDEAKAFARIQSDRSWRRFCQAMQLDSVSEGRYEIQAIERALAREIRESKKRS